MAPRSRHPSPYPQQYHPATTFRDDPESTTDNKLALMQASLIRYTAEQANERDRESTRLGFTLSVLFLGAAFVLTLLSVYLPSAIAESTINLIWTCAGAGAVGGGWLGRQQPAALQAIATKLEENRYRPTAASGEPPLHYETSEGENYGYEG